MNAAAADEELEEGVDLRTLFERAVVGRWWIASSLVLFSALFCAIALLTPPVYRAATVLVPASNDRGANIAGLGGSQLGGLAAIAGLGVEPWDAETEEALAVFRSREFTERFIADRNLMPRLFPEKWNKNSGSWAVDEQRRPTMARAYKFFTKKVRSVMQDRKTGLITVQIDWTDRDEAALWANELVRVLNEEMRARAIAKADASVEFLQKESQATSTVETREAISRLLEVQLKQLMLAHVTRDYSFRVVDKAITSDGEDPVKPRKVLLFIAGPLVGLLVGVIAALLFGSRNTDRR
jgi:uncharacterized protein involved in exopolysaccharide biosynthesis